jgi:hypothetical protein
MDREQKVREMIAAEIAPLVAQCESMIDRAEAASPPILLDRVARDAASAARDQWRARADALIKECSELKEKILKLPTKGGRHGEREQLFFKAITRLDDRSGGGYTAIK